MTQAAPDDTPHPALTAALHYARRGWRVVPILRGQKYPPISQWQRLATTNPAEIHRWWKGATHGVGIATGSESGIFVLDVDIGPDKHGDETLADLEAVHGRLPETATVLTGSGGRHHYYLIPHGVEIRNEAGTRLGAGLDIRGEGGQVLAPPTIHPNGQPYEWEHSAPVDPVHPPQWLVDKLTQPTNDTPRSEHTPYTGTERPGDRFAAHTTWPQLLERDGARFMQRCHDHQGRPYEMWARPGVEHASASLYYGGTDLLKIFTSNWPGLDEGATYTKFGYFATRHFNGDYHKAASHMAQKEAQGTDVDGMIADMPPPPDDTEPSDEIDDPDAALLAQLIEWPRFWAKDREGENWLAYPLVPAGRQVALYAPAKGAKSYLALQVCAGLATGRSILGQPAGQRRHVLYLDYEMTEEDLEERLTEFGYEDTDDLTHLHYWLLPNLPPLNRKEGAAMVLRLAELVDAELVVIDTFGRAVEGEENDNDTTRDFWTHTGRRLKAAGRALLRTDHAGKDIGKGQRGGSAKNDDVDVVYQLSWTNSGVLLKATHRRIRWAPDKLELDYRIVDGIHGHYLTAMPSLPDGTQAVIADLERLEVSIELGGNKAFRLLRDKGCGHNRSAVLAAVRHRKEESQRWYQDSRYHLSEGGTSENRYHLHGNGPLPGAVPPPVPPGTTPTPDRVVGTTPWVVPPPMVDEKDERIDDGRIFD